ncbi:hypothetical protein TNCV_4577641 [Trichonephila clavipes]|nr:hypothetical protein TNCV_4577641 [Trichonephila clavipes]
MILSLLTFIGSSCFPLQLEDKSSGRGGLVVKVTDSGLCVMSSSTVPPKTRRVGQRCMLNRSRAQTSSRLPMLRMRVSMSCRGIAAHSYCSANRSSRIVTGGKVRAAKRLPRKSHTCSMGLRSGDRAG